MCVWALSTPLRVFARHMLAHAAETEREYEAQKELGLEAAGHGGPGATGAANNGHRRNDVQDRRHASIRKESISRGAIALTLHRRSPSEDLPRWFFACV